MSDDLKLPEKNKDGDADKIFLADVPDKDSYQALWEQGSGPKYSIMWAVIIGVMVLSVLIKGLLSDSATAEPKAKMEHMGKILEQQRQSLKDLRAMGFDLPDLPPTPYDDQLPEEAAE